MVLKKIKYHNFRPFIGDQEMYLTSASDNFNENVVVILGDNTRGKSTFVLSFVWCLYPEHGNPFKKPAILNKKVEAAMNLSDKETAFVEIEFSDNGLDYTLRRTETFVLDKNGKLKSDKGIRSMAYTLNSGETKSIESETEIQRVIKSILPHDLSPFFFFEGEKDNEINQKDLSKSVKTLLGLDAYDEMQSHLFGSKTQSSPYAESVMGKYQKKQNDESTQKANEAYERKINAEGIITKLNNEIKEKDENIQSYEEKIKEIDRKQKESAPLEGLQKQRESCQSELEKEKRTLADNKKKFLSLFSHDSFYVWISPLLKKASERLQKSEVSDKGIRGIEVTAIYELLKRGMCLCGTDLREGSAAYKSVRNFENYVAPISVGTSIGEMQDNIAANEEKVKKFIEEFEEVYKAIQKSKQEINKYEKKSESLSYQIEEKSKKIGNPNIMQLEEDRKRYERKVNELRAERDKLIKEQAVAENEAENSEKEFNKYKSKSDKAKEYQLYYQYAKAVYQWVNQNYTEKETEMRRRLSDLVEELFNSMYSGERKVVIDEKYNIQMTYQENDIDDTGGLRVLQYFAYVGGLVKLAYQVMQERTNKKDEEYQMTLVDQYPLVLDAAFSHADQFHTKHIAEELSKSASQLIFALMYKDWEFAKEGLIGRIGRKYELKKIDETETKIISIDCEVDT